MSGTHAALAAALLTLALAACATDRGAESHSSWRSFCSAPIAEDLEILEISDADRRAICSLVARRSDYAIVLVARSHEEIYDFPMLEIHMAETADSHPSTGPVFFYWKQSDGWSELEEVSTWWQEDGL